MSRFYTVSLWRSDAGDEGGLRAALQGGKELVRRAFREGTDWIRGKRNWEEGIPFKEKSCMRGRWAHLWYSLQVPLKCWARHKSAKDAWGPPGVARLVTAAGRGGAKCGLGTLCTHLSLQSLALGLTDLVEKEVPQKGKTGFPFAPRVPSEPFQRRVFERKEYTWTNSANKLTTAATNRGALSRVEVCGKHLLHLSPQHSPMWGALISWSQGPGSHSYGPSLKPKRPSCTPCWTHFSGISPSTTNPLPTPRGFENHKEAEREAQRVDT